MSDEMDRSESFGTLGANPLEQQVAGTDHPMTDATSSVKSGVKKVETPQIITISRDRTNEQVLQFNMDTGIRLAWDPDDFRELPEDVARQLTYDNLKSYLKTQYVVKEKAATAAAAGRIEVRNPINPLGMNSEFRLQIRARKGWHQCWKSPGNELEAALAGPYKQVRKQALKKDKDGKQVYDKDHQPAYEDAEPGQENGEVLKIQDETGKVELVAVECRQELYEEYLEYMAEKSRLMYGANKGKFVENVEEINKNLKRDNRMKVLDGEQVIN